MLQIIDGSWTPNAHDLASNLVPGFGVTTMIINGGIQSEQSQVLLRLLLQGGPGCQWRKVVVQRHVPVPAHPWTRRSGRGSACMPGTK